MRTALHRAPRWTMALVLEATYASTKPNCASLPYLPRYLFTQTSPRQPPRRLKRCHVPRHDATRPSALVQLWALKDSALLQASTIPCPPWLRIAWHENVHTPCTEGRVMVWTRLCANRVCAATNEVTQTAAALLQRHAPGQNACAAVTGNRTPASREQCGLPLLTGGDTNHYTMTTVSPERGHSAACRSVQQQEERFRYRDSNPGLESENLVS